MDGFLLRVQNDAGALLRGGRILFKRRQKRLLDFFEHVGLGYALFLFNISDR